MRVLLLEPDDDYVDMISSLLAADGWRTTPVARGDELSHLLAGQEFDLSIVDAAAAFVGGQSVCRDARDLSLIPIIVLASPTDESLAARHLQEGADFYLLKPFNPKQLKATAKALLRRVSRTGAAQREIEVSAEGVRINLVRREVVIGDRIVRLPPKEFDLLYTLVANRGMPLSRSQLAAAAWGAEYEDADRQVYVYIRRLRTKIERDPDQPELLLTERGYGYRFRK